MKGSVQETSAAVAVSPKEVLVEYVCKTHGPLFCAGCIAPKVELRQVLKDVVDTALSDSSILARLADVAGRKLSGDAVPHKGQMPDGLDKSKSRISASGGASKKKRLGVHSSAKRLYKPQSLTSSFSSPKKRSPSKSSSKISLSKSAGGVPRRAASTRLPAKSVFQGLPKDHDFQVHARTCSNEKCSVALADALDYLFCDICIQETMKCVVHAKLEESRKSKSVSKSASKSESKRNSKGNSKIELKSASKSEISSQSRSKRKSKVCQAVSYCIVWFFVVSYHSATCIYSETYNMLSY